MPFRTAPNSSRVCGRSAGSNCSILTIRSSWATNSVPRWSNTDPAVAESLPIGARVVSVPILLRPQPIQIGFGGVATPGGYAEYMVLSEDLLIPVPDNVADDTAALAEPLTVALHAVNRGALGSDDVPIVIGCGPIGLAVIAVLKMRGVGPIIAADFSPARRALASALGADVVVDPRETSPYDSWLSVAAVSDPARYGRQTTMFPQFAFRPSVVFECVGVPGVIQQILAGAAPCTKVVVAGLCMQEDSFQPTFGILKEIDLIFCISYTFEEYATGPRTSGRRRAAGRSTDHQPYRP